MIEKPKFVKDQGRTPQTIIDGAISVIAETGLRHLTTKRVSEKAEVSTASIHYFFDTKENLITQSFAHVMGLMWERICRVQDLDISPIDKIKRTLDVFFEDQENGVETVRIWHQLWHHAGLNSEIGQLFHNYNTGLLNLFEDYLVAAGMSPDKARIFAFRLNAMHRGLWIELKVGGVLKAEEIVRIFASVLDSIRCELREEGNE